MNNPHPNQFAQVQYLKMMYRGIVDDDVLERFTDAILEADTMPAIPDGKPVDRQWILAADPYGNSLTLGHRGTIESAAVIAAAKSWASTWGQFLALLGDRAREVKEHIRIAARYPDFQVYFTRQLIKTPDRKLDEFWAEWCALTPFYDRPPMDHDEFDQGDYECWLFEHGIEIPDMRQMALFVLPKTILQTFATIEGVFRRVHENEILDRFLARVEAMAEDPEWSVEDEVEEVDEEDECGY